MYIYTSLSLTLVKPPFLIPCIFPLPYIMLKAKDRRIRKQLPGKWRKWKKQLKSEAFHWSLTLTKTRKCCLLIFFLQNLFGKKRKNFTCTGLENSAVCSEYTFLIEWRRFLRIYVFRLGTYFQNKGEFNLILLAFTRVQYDVLTRVSGLFWSTYEFGGLIWN